MAGEDETLRIFIEAITEGATTELRKFEEQVKATTGEVGLAAKQTQTFGESHRTASMHVYRMSAGLSQITSAVATLNPNFRAVIGLTDNLAFAMLRAGTGATSLSEGLIAGLKFAFNPITLAIVGVTAVLGYLIPKWIEAKKAAEDFQAAMGSGNLGLLQAELKKVDEEINKINKSMAEVASSGPTFTDRLKAYWAGGGQGVGLVGALTGNVVQQQRLQDLNDQAVAAAKKRIELEGGIQAVQSKDIQQKLDIAELDRQIAATENPRLIAGLELKKKNLAIDQQVHDSLLSATDAERLKAADAEAAYAKVNVQQQKAYESLTVTAAQSAVATEKALASQTGYYDKLDAAEQKALATEKERAIAEAQRTGDPRQVQLTQEIYAGKQIVLNVSQEEATRKRVQAATADQIKSVEYLNQLEAEAFSYVDKLDAQVLSYGDQLEKQLADINRELAVARMPEGPEKAAAQIMLPFNAQIAALRDLAKEYPKLGSTIDDLVPKIEALGQASVDASKKTQDTLTAMNIALTESFVQGFDRAYDQLFDTSKNFGQRMIGLFAGIGEGLVKSILHGMLTVPFQQQLMSQGGLLGMVLQMFPSIAGMFGGISGALGALPGAISFSMAPAGTLAGGFMPFIPFAEGGMVYGHHGPLPNWVRDLPPSIPRLQMGAHVRGPTLAVLGEGGQDEYVIPANKMGKKDGGTTLEQKIYLVDSRPKSLGPKDVVVVLSKDILDNGLSGKAVLTHVTRNR